LHPTAQKIASYSAVSAFSVQTYANANATLKRRADLSHVPIQVDRKMLKTTDASNYYERTLPTIQACGYQCGYEFSWLQWLLKDGDTSTET
jgi:AraC-like DNA-binding protein